MVDSGPDIANWVELGFFGLAFIVMAFLKMFLWSEGKEGWYYELRTYLVNALIATYLALAAVGTLQAWGAGVTEREDGIDAFWGRWVLYIAAQTALIVLVSVFLRQRASSALHQGVVSVLGWSALLVGTLTGDDARWAAFGFGAFCVILWSLLLLLDSDVDYEPRARMWVWVLYGWLWVTRIIYGIVWIISPAGTDSASNTVSESLYVVNDVLTFVGVFVGLMLINKANAGKLAGYRLMNRGGTKGDFNKHYAPNRIEDVKKAYGEETPA